MRGDIEMSFSSSRAPEAGRAAHLLRAHRLFSFAMLYHIIAWCARVAMRWCYRDAHVVGRIPPRGPVLLAVNHPNDLPDICAILGFVPRRVTFVANVTSAEQPIVAWAYRQMGVVPVHRVRDARRAKARGLDSVAANEQAFSRVRELLASGACVCVFPEGGVQRGTHLGPLRTGLARMALQAQQAGVRDLTIVPVGLVYESARELRSRMVAVVGEPLELRAWTPDAGRPPEPQLTAEIAGRLRSLTRNAPDQGSATVLAHLAAAVSAVSSAAEPLLDGTRAWQSVTGATYGPGIAPEPGQDRRLDAVRAMSAAFDATRRATFDGTSDATRAAAPSVSRLLLAWRHGADRNARARWLAPLALIGLALHAPAWAAIAAVARRSAASPAEEIPRRIVPGLYLMWGWYLFVFVLLLIAMPLPWPMSLSASILLVAALPPLGTMALRWRDAVHDRRWRRWLLARVPDAAARIEAAARCDRAHSTPHQRANAPELSPTIGES